jgi:hypothetical protein
VTPVTTLAGFDVAVDGALGAEILPYVGDDADVTRFDPFATEAVRVVPAAVGVHLAGPGGVFGALRVEEGVVHAGGLEAAEARVGWAQPKGWIAASLGRGDVPLTRDRDLEVEDLVFSVRPVLSRAFLPLHATGANATFAWPDRAHAELGASWPALTSDAPYLWARLAIHPLGSLADAQDAPADGPRVQLAGGIARLDSPSIGQQLLLAGDLSVVWGPVFADAGWIRAADTTTRDEWLGEAGVGIGRRTGPQVHVAARMEHVTGLEPGEDARWIAAGRVALRLREGHVSVYAEALHSIEVGAAASADEDVVVLDDSIERANDSVALGVLLRL